MRVCVCRNVTPQSRLDLKLWSCHTLRKELLGSATIDLLDTLRTHDGRSEQLFCVSDITKANNDAFYLQAPFKTL